MLNHNSNDIIAKEVVSSSTRSCSSNSSCLGSFACQICFFFCRRFHCTILLEVNTLAFTSNLCVSLASTIFLDGRQKTSVGSSIGDALRSKRTAKLCGRCLASWSLSTSSSSPEMVLERLCRRHASGCYVPSVILAKTGNKCSSFSLRIWSNGVVIIRDCQA